MRQYICMSPLYGQQEPVPERPEPASERPQRGMDVTTFGQMDRGTERRTDSTCILRGPCPKSKYSAPS